MTQCTMTHPPKDISVNEIIPGLFVGNMACVERERVLRELKITAVVSVVSEYRRPFPQTSTSYGLLGRRRRHALEKLVDINNRHVIFVEDRASDNIFRHFEGACHFINHRLHPISVSNRTRPDRKACGERTGNSPIFKEAVVKKSDHVLVHCTLGKSRSVCIVAAYMMWRWDVRAHEALRYIQNKRSIAFPNEGFIDQLLVWEKLKCNPWLNRCFRIRPRAYHDMRVRLEIYKQIREVRTAIERAPEDDNSMSNRQTKVVTNGPRRQADTSANHAKTRRSGSLPGRRSRV
ncbi:hypothetical protein diail_1048 [Diaporthe ilicicola]|nr:hypothetical protein diail_1048 [Diaporthe ilicicola]